MPQPLGRGAVVRGVDIRLVEASRVAGVEQVVDVDADVGARAAEPDDLREAHVDLRPALVGVDAVLVVGEQDRRRAGRRARPSGRWPSAAAITEFGTCQFAVMADAGCERSTVLTSTSIFGTV